MVEKVVELSGTSTRSIEDAVALVISRASVTIFGIREATVTHATALVEGGRITGWKVEVRVRFQIEDRLHE
jgi:flavin-binding protein dodecin